MTDMTDISSYFASEDTSIDEEGDVDMALLESDNEEDQDDLMEESPNEISEKQTANFMIKETTVPLGWTVKGQGSHMKVTSPTGGKFNSRRTAFVDMVNSGKYSVREIKEMKSCLKHEGWKTDEKLPKGWMMKQKKDKRLHLLGLGGELFDSVSKAAEFVTKYQKYFCQEDFEKILKMNKETKSNNSVNYKADPRDNSWIDGSGENSCPIGWKFKNSLNVTSLISPNGIKIKGRRSALLYMTSNNYPEEEIQIVRNGLKKEGWKTDESLPQNWLYKSKSGGLIYCSPKGKLFDSKEKLFKDDMTSEKDLKKLKLFQLNGKKNLDDSSWTKNDPTVPAGWGIKEVDFRKSKVSKLLSPDGRFHASRRAALKFLVDEKYSDEKIEEMRGMLKHDGWLKHEHLPEKWFFKKSKDLADISFISHDGLYLKTIGLAIRHLNINSGDEDLILFFKFLENCKKPIPDLKQNKPTDSFEEYSDCDHTMPKGWKFKKIQVNGGGIFKVFLTPSGDKIKGKRSALKYMLDKGYPQKDIISLRNSLKEDGWKTNERLPLNWFFKEGKRTYFLGQNGDFFKSKDKGLQYLKLQKMNDDFQILSQFTLDQNPSKDNSSKSKNVSSEGFTDCDQSMPQGWRHKSILCGDRTLNFFLTPSGEKMKSKKSTLKYMVERGYPERYIISLRNSLKEDGWKTSERLPLNWFFREGDRTNFLSHNGDFFKSKEKGLQYLKLQNMNDDFQILSKFTLDQNPSMQKDNSSKSKNVSFEGFTDCDQSMPQGWRHKRVKLGGDRNFDLFLTPSCERIKGKKSTLKYMMERGYPERYITSIRNSFKEEGWKTSDRLPVNWFFKVGQRLCFINPNGDYFNSKIKALEHLKSQNLNEDFHKLSKFTQHQNPSEKNVSTSKSKNVSYEGFVDCNKTMPQGWKYKNVKKCDGKSHKVFLSPSGDKTKGKKSTLKYMLERGYSESDITILRNSFREEGWKTSERLPVNWFFKQDQRLCFLSQNGTYLQSKAKAIEYLKSKNLKQDLQMVSNFTAQ